MRIAFDLAADWERFTLAAQADITANGVTAVFGPSGSGKTTLLQAIAGFRRQLGDVQIDGATWQASRTFVPPHKRPVGQVFQAGRLFEHLTVAQNLTFAERRASRDGPVIARGDVIRDLEIADLLDRRPATLSGGEQQRVAIARALLTRPHLMLMDEPLAALDRARKARILRMIAALPANFGVPVLFVSHQLDEIVQIADRLLAMREGRVVGEGPVADMLDDMDAETTGRFEAGALLEGLADQHHPTASMMAIRIGGTHLWIPDVGGVTVGERVRVRVRARDVSIALTQLPGISIRNQLPATVVDVSVDDTPFAEVRLDCGGQTLRARISRFAVEDLALTPGLEVWALIKSVAFDRRFVAR
jgi:molybdate transport system ATP-binding protein